MTTGSRRGGRSRRPRATVSRYFDHDGPVHYRDYGGDNDGPLVVCVHGLNGSALDFELLAPLLAARCRVYAVDLIGHGRTPALGRSATVGANRDMVARFLRDVVGEPALLVGNSMGGLVAALLAARTPKAVAGLVLISPALPLTTLLLRDVRTVAQFLVLSAPGLGGVLIGAYQRLASAELQVARTIRSVVTDPTRVPQEVVDAATALIDERRRYAGNAAALVEAARSLLWVVQSPWYSAQLDRIEAPVLLVHGSQDRLVSIRHASAVAERFESWRFETLEHAGHVPMLEEPDMVAATVFDWLFSDAAEAAEEAASARIHQIVIDVSDSRHARQ